jgi:tRNA uridine 5-carboxymethylaminomethyl modification enzyme
MFTSRAEYRLLLRADNADERLTPRGLLYGCVGQERETVFNTKAAELAKARSVLCTLITTPSILKKNGLRINQDGVRRSAFELLSYPNIFIKDLITIWPQLDKLSPSLAERLEIESLYSGYVRRQKADVEAFRRDEHLSLPEHLNYSEIAGLSREVQDKLQASRPNTLGQAGRIPGVTPAALVTLLRFVRRAENSFEREVRSA